MEREELVKVLKEKIRPSRDHPTSSAGMFYYPCGVVLKDGIRNDQVLFVNRADFLKHWGWIPKPEVSIQLEEVVDIYASPFRLPAELAQEVYSRGETGMGFYGFWLIMKDGERFPYITGGAVDLIELPEGYSMKDIKEVGPPTRSGEGHRIYRHKVYYWCLVDNL